MNKTELVAAIAAKAGISKKDADAALSAFADSIIAEIKKGGKVQIVGFGTFEARKRAASALSVSSGSSVLPSQAARNINSSSFSPLAFRSSRM